jgi:hypothetical protein
LDKRSIIIVWRRTYQQICRLTGHEEAMPAEYRKLLAAEQRGPGIWSKIHSKTAWSGKFCSGISKLILYYPG